MGCFHPGVNKVVIYADLLEQIYIEGRTVSLEHDDVEENYRKIQQKVSKKGLYRKLIDHLMSHRRNVNSCMETIFRHVKQRRDTHSYFIHLTLIDQMARHFQSFVDDVPLAKRKPEEEEESQSESVKSQYINRDIEVKFETLYFQMILEIFDEDPEIRVCILKSLKSYAQKRRNFTDTKLVEEVIERLLDLIKSDVFLKEATETYSLLVDKSSSNALREERSEEALQIFLELWLCSRHETLRRDCEKIFRIYIQKCLTSRQYSAIFTVIFEIEDRYLFQENTLQELELKLFGIVQNQDFKDQFFKGIFKYLVSYLCVCDDERVRNKWELGLFDITYPTLKNKYPNILKRQAKINAFGTLLRWIRLGVVNPNEFILYNRVSMMYCLIFNVCANRTDKEILEITVETFFEIYRACNEPCKGIICSLLFEQIHLSDYTVIEETSIIVRINQKILEDLASTKLDEGNYHLFAPISSELPLQTKIELVQLGCSLLECFETPFSVLLLENICGFVHSFELFLDSSGYVKEQYQLSCSMLSFFKKLRDKGEVEVVMAFVKRYSEHRQLIESYDGIYFSGYLLLQICEALTKKKLVPPEVQRLNLHIYCTDNNSAQKDIKKLISLNRSLLDCPPSLLPLPPTSSEPKIFSILSEFQKWERYKINHQEDIELNFATTNLQRKKSWISSNHQSFNTDETFTNIFEMINDKHLRE